ncbi:MAG: glycine cleavage system protein GcvH [Thermaerobacter sp.]|nr:glycine cleavage system protein GcvH [Thermaerobacter sp.]
MNIPEDLQYTREHEWLGKDGRIGITDYAQEALGDVVYVELPEVGRVLKPGDIFGVVESVKSASDLYSPTGGTVIRVNPALADHPELVNQDPYGSGWIMELAEPAGGDLMDAAAYRRQVGA